MKPNDEDKFSIEGLRAVETALRSPVEILEVVLDPSALERAEQDPYYRRINALIEKRGVRSREATRRDKPLFNSKSSQGIVLIAQRPSPVDPGKAFAAGDRVLILDGLRDPANAGALVRSGLLLGWDTILCTPGTVDLYGPKAARASAGAICFVNVGSAEASGVSDAAAKAGYRLCAAVAAGGVAPEEMRAEKIGLIVGNEAHGMLSSWETAEEVTLRTASVPIDSLSAAAGGSILLYILRS